MHHCCRETHCLSMLQRNTLSITAAENTLSITAAEKHTVYHCCRKTHCLSLLQRNTLSITAAKKFCCLLFGALRVKNDFYFFCLFVFFRNEHQVQVTVNVLVKHLMFGKRSPMMKRNDSNKYLHVFLRN